MRTLAWAWPDQAGMISWVRYSQIGSASNSELDHVGILRFRGCVAARYQLGIIVTGLIKDWQTCRLELSPRRTLLTPDMVESTFSFLMDRRDCTWNLNAMPAKRQSLWWGSGCNVAIQIPKCGNSRTWVELIYELMAIGWEVPNSSKFDLQFSPSIHRPRRNPSKSTSATATKP